jgi:hypothetical protein
VPRQDEQQQQSHRSLFACHNRIYGESIYEAERGCKRGLFHYVVKMLLLLAVVSSALGQTPWTIVDRVNFCGGGAVTDADGHVWRSDLTLGTFPRPPRTIGSSLDYPRIGGDNVAVDVIHDYSLTPAASRWNNVLASQCTHTGSNSYRIRNVLSNNGGYYRVSFLFEAISGEANNIFNITGPVSMLAGSSWDDDYYFSDNFFPFIADNAVLHANVNLAGQYGYATPITLSVVYFASENLAYPMAVFDITTTDDAMPKAGLAGMYVEYSATTGAPTTKTPTAMPTTSAPTTMPPTSSSKFSLYMWLCGGVLGFAVLVILVTGHVVRRRTTPQPTSQRITYTKLSQ